MEKASTADMVKDAIETLGERTGSSLHNIKKYIEAVYKVDMRYRAPRIRKFLRTAVGDGVVVQTRGRGASGSFKLPSRQRQLQQPSASMAAPAKKAASRTNSAPMGGAKNAAKKAPSRTMSRTMSRTTSTARKASGTTVSTSASRASAASARSVVSNSSVSSASTASTRSIRARRI